MAGSLEVFYTVEAKSQLDAIINYLNDNWTNKEYNDFLDLLLHFENLIARFPNSFKKSRRFKNCRLGLVHRHISAVYSIANNKIIILTFIDNRSSIAK
jgi:plasmid stabilization system protein ParE